MKNNNNIPYGRFPCKKCGSFKMIDTITTGTYERFFVCKDCGHEDDFEVKWNQRYRDFQYDELTYIDKVVEKALKEYDKKFKALLLMMVQKGLINNVNELEEVLNSINVLDKLQDKE